MEALARFTGVLIILAIAAPWHVLATLRMPPYSILRCIAAPASITAFFGSTHQ